MELNSTVMIYQMNFGELMKPYLLGEKEPAV